MEITRLELGYDIYDEDGSTRYYGIDLLAPNAVRNSDNLRTLTWQNFDRFLLMRALHHLERYHRPDWQGCREGLKALVLIEDAGVTALRWPRSTGTSAISRKAYLHAPPDVTVCANSYIILAENLLREALCHTFRGENEDLRALIERFRQRTLGLEASPYAQSCAR